MLRREHKNDVVRQWRHILNELAGWSNNFICSILGLRWEAERVRGGEGAWMGHLSQAKST